MSSSTVHLPHGEAVSAVIDHLVQEMAADQLSDTLQLLYLASVDMGRLVYGGLIEKQTAKRLLMKSAKEFGIVDRYEIGSCYENIALGVNEGIESLPGLPPLEVEHEEKTEQTAIAQTPHFEMKDPGGILGKMIRYITENSRRPQPIFAIGASLCALGALIGRKYRTESDLRSNLYIVALGDSGSGKNDPRVIISKWLREAGLQEYLGGNKIASGPGLLTAVTRQPSILFQLDEFGMFLEAIADRKHSPRHIAQILEYMLELSTSANDVFQGTEYADQKQRPRVDINQPNLCIFGTTTPLRFWNALQSANAVDGTLARFIVIKTENDYPDENLEIGICTSPPELLEVLKLVANGGGKTNGNLNGIGSDPCIAVNPMTVPMDVAAKNRFHALSAEMNDRLKKASGTHLTPLIARLWENSAKVALICAVSRNPVEPVISIEDAEWSIRFVCHYAEKTIIGVRDKIADNDTERYHKKFFSIIKDAGANGISRRALSRKTQFLDHRQREQILRTLIHETEQVIEVQKPTATKPTTVYVAV